MQGTTWFTMPPKRPSTEIHDTIIAQGCFTKSPPSFLFGKKASWKDRTFRLCKTLTDTYYIRYYSVDGATEKCKGEIAVSDINSIELGSNSMEKIPTITRLFSNSPENILCIKTSDRDFYLIDESKKNILDWQKSVTEVWVKINKKEHVDGPKIAHKSLFIPPPDPTMARLPRALRGLAVYPIQNHQPAVQLVRSHQYGSQTLTTMGEAARPKSYPDDHPCTDPAPLDKQDRQRALTDPEARRALPSIPSDQVPFRNPLEMLGQNNEFPERKRSETYNDATVWSSKNSMRKSVVSEQSRESEDTAYSSESESIYDYPRPSPVRKQFPMDSEEEEDEESDCVDSPDTNVYLPMWPVQQNSYDSEKEVTDSTGESQSSRDAQDCLGVEKHNDLIPPKPPRHSGPKEPNRHPNQRSQLKKVNILKMMYEQDSSDYETKYLSIPTAHLQQYLNLQEVGERLCVSKWKGPVEIGCVFYHGDHIEAVNGLRPENKDFFFQMLGRSINDKVNLVVIRNKKANVFHAEGCNCGQS